ncbi:MAG: proton-conducting transporter membrane subunit, partial [bacterium]
QDMRRMGGLKKYMPITFATMLTGWLAISGIPIFAGFFSKDEILWRTWSAATLGLPGPAWSKALWFVGALTALLTAVYMTRMMVLTFWGSERFREKQVDHLDGAQGIHADSRHDDHAFHEPHESPWLMTAPLVVLAILSTIGGFIGVPYALGSLVGLHPTNYIEQTLDPVIAKVPGGKTEGAPTAAEPIWLSPPPQATDSAPAFVSLDESAAPHSAEAVRAERLLALVSVAIAVLGIVLGWIIFQKRPLLALPRLLENKYYVDEIYDAAVINPINAGSREGLWKVFDVGVIDGFLHAVADTVIEGGRAIRHLQGGFVRSYAAIILVGALAVIGFFAYYGVHAMRFLP